MSAKFLRRPMLPWMRREEIASDIQHAKQRLWLATIDTPEHAELLTMASRRLTEALDLIADVDQADPLAGATRPLTGRSTP